MAIVVVAILMTAISRNHPLGCNSGSSRRVELATLAAKAYVNGLRAGTIVAQAPQFNSLKVSISLKALLLIARQPTALYCVDLDNLDNDGLSLDDPDGCTATSPKDLAIQAFQRYPPSSDANDGYRLGCESHEMPLRTAVL